MLRKEVILNTLDRARRIDDQFELFGAKKHQYQLNTPIAKAVVRSIQQAYGFKLVEDYFYFITEIADGGAGPDYGIHPFTNFLEVGRDEVERKYFESYRQGIAKPFAPRAMTADEVDAYGFTKDAYHQHPSRFFVFETYDEEAGENMPCMDGFFVIGTHGCQWDFGIIMTGEHRGKVFDTDNEGGFCLLANSFDEFYQQWLDKLLDINILKKSMQR